MADARDLKSRGDNSPCGFESRLGYLLSAVVRSVQDYSKAPEKGLLSTSLLGVEIRRRESGLCSGAVIHDAVTHFTMYTYNFCWPVRTLRQQGPDGQWLPRTPAMAAGLTDHVWPLWEWLTFPAVQRE